MKKYFAVIACLVIVSLGGCAVSEQDQRNAPPTITNYVEKAKSDVKDDMKDYVNDKLNSQKEATDEKFKSQNAIQANVNSLLGASVGKIGEEVTGVKLDLNNQIKLNNEMSVKLDNQIKISNEMSVKLENQIKINNEMSVKLDNQIKINNEMEAKFKVEADAAVAAQAGVDNKINTMKTELTNDLKAGRDVNQINFDVNALDAVRSGNLTAICIIAGFALISIVLILVVGYVLVKSHSEERSKAEVRTQDAMKVVSKCMGFMPPEAARELSKDIQALHPKA